MIKYQPISAKDIDQITQFVLEDIQTSEDTDITELIGMHLENTAGCESLSAKKTENLIITIKTKVDEFQQTIKGDQ
ncbi:MAG: hypothetical protein KUG79_08360 [Pseudomonadales bacterium]|nr:hypothetical protein [Pseudomonadales bacterium]